ncbi:MAG: uroporphyrinogen-III C-methyltransferase [Verrucomicrobiota bacterium]
MKSPGVQCYLIGAGPGDPGLLTIRAREVLSFVDVVIYDSLVNEAILDHCRKDCERIFAGKRAGFHHLSQDEIHQTMIQHLQAGRTIARLKGGDPFVFARGGEEMEAVDEAGFGFEVIPGITSGSAVPAYAGIPLTHREWASHVTFVTAHERKDAEKSRIEWKRLAQLGGTLVVFMGAKSVKFWTQNLIGAGLDPETPAAFIQWGTRTYQRCVFGTVQTLESSVRGAGLSSPAIAVIGQTASLRDRLKWFEIKPLFGKRVVVTRSKEQNTSLRIMLRELGAEVLEIPTISIHPIDLPADIDRRIAATQWLAFSSSNGVEYFLDAYCCDHDIRTLAHLKIAAVGSSTAATLRRYHLQVDYVPSEYRSAAMGQQWPDEDRDHHVMYVCGSSAEADFQQAMESSGYVFQRMEVYRTHEGIDASSPAADTYRNQGADWLTFCSSSAARAFHAAFSAEIADTQKMAAIGPVTQEQMHKLGWSCTVMPEVSKLDLMVDKIVEHETSGSLRP